MAEIWPRLKTKLVMSTGEAGKSRKSSSRWRSKSKKANPYSSPGSLQKFAALLDEIQAARKQGAASRAACAARSVSRSAQEWSTVLSTTTSETAKVEVLELDQVKSEESTVGIRSTSSQCEMRCACKAESAYVVLLAMGTFLLNMLTFRVCHKGKLSVRLMFSSTVLYVLTPLRSYLVTSRGLHRTPEIVITPVPDTPIEEEESVLLPIPETKSMTVTTGASMTVTTGTSMSTVTTSKSRRLAKKIVSKVKKLNMFTSSSSASSSSSESSGTVSEPSSPDRHRMCRFSKELSPLMRRQRSSDSMGACKRSKLGRRLSSETLEDYNQLSECTSSSSSFQGKLVVEGDSGNTAAPSSSPWPVVGLLITLLFLLVGRFPAIMATSLFFVVVSHDGSRAGRDNHRALEAARKLQRNALRR